MVLMEEDILSLLESESGMTDTLHSITSFTDVIHGIQVRHANIVENLTKEHELLANKVDEKATTLDELVNGLLSLQKDISLMYDRNKRMLEDKDNELIKVKSELKTVKGQLKDSRRKNITALASDEDKNRAIKSLSEALNITYDNKVAQDGIDESSEAIIKKAHAIKNEYKRKNEENIRCASINKSLESRLINITKKNEYFLRNYISIKDSDNRLKAVKDELFQSKAMLVAITSAFLKVLNENNRMEITIEVFKNQLSSIPKDIKFDIEKECDARSQLQHEKNISLILESGQFDQKYYLEKNPDVKESEFDAVEHYLLYGFEELRAPNPDFNSIEYIYENIPKIKDDINPFIAYLRDSI